MVKFLIVRFSSIGDIVLTTPVVRCLKQQVEEANIHFLTKKQYLPVVKNNPYIDKIHLLDNNFKKLTAELRKENFDYIIDLHKNLRTSRLKINLKRISFSFNKLNFKKWLLVNFKIHCLPKIHIVDRYFKAVSIFSVKNDNKGLDYFIDESEDIKNSNLPKEFANKYIVFVIGAKHYTKQLPEQKIISIINKINYPVVLLGGEEDFQKGKNIEEKSTCNVYNACGKLMLNESAFVIQNSKLVIAHDTGLMHIAAAFNKKIISIWGNTIPGFGMYPYNADKDSLIAEVQGLKCRPCTKIGYKKCPKGHFNCMNKIDEQKIVNHVKMILNKINS